ncbi:MAG TPA: PhoU domain-containing protein [Dysgonamonadaceae bacterium]|nr:PhoU domain-containing protein [Dysgonamonadaceae bacterium]
MDTFNNNLGLSNSLIKEKYLEELQSDFRILSEIVLNQIALTQKLLENNLDEEVLMEISRNEKIIDSLDLTIREKVINAIILFTPRATDLRKIMAYHDITISMERVGDQILNVAGFLKKTDLSIEGFEEYRGHLDKMLIYAGNMLKNAIFSFTGLSHELAYETIQMDDKVDKWDKKMEKRLAEGFKDKVLSHQALVNIMSITAISYNIERVADMAVNMAEAAIYLVEGKDVRHHKIEEKKPPTQS